MFDKPHAVGMQEAGAQTEWRRGTGGFVFHGGIVAVQADPQQQAGEARDRAR
jgi:hypothetical protein